MFIELLIFCIPISIFVFAAYYIAFWVTWDFSERLDIPYIPTPLYSLSQIAYRLVIRKGDIVYDIGCGDGRLLFYCAKRYPAAKFIGIELNPMLVAWIKLRKFAARAHNVEIRRENIFEADVSNATKIYAFLLPDLTDKFFSDRTFSGVRIVSRAFQIRGRKPKETFRITPHDIWYGGHLAYVYE